MENTKAIAPTHKAPGDWEVEILCCRVCFFSQLTFVGWQINAQRVRKSITLVCKGIPRWLQWCCMWLGIFLENSNLQNTDKEMFLFQVAPLSSSSALPVWGYEACASIARPVGWKGRAHHALCNAAGLELHSHTGLCLPQHITRCQIMIPWPVSPWNVFVKT